MKNITLKNVIEFLGVWAIGSLIFGCVIVNLYLGQFGFWDYNFLRFQYIASGTLFVIFVCVTAILSLLSFILFVQIRDSYRIDNRYVRKIYLYLLKTITLAVITFLNTFFFLLIIKGNGVITTSVVIFSISAFWVISICILVRFCLRAYLKRPKKSDASTLSTIKEIISIFKYFYIPVIFLLLLTIFSNLIYPLVPRAWGGGQPVQVSIELKDNRENYTSAKLLYQSSDSVIINFNGSTFLIPNSEISSIQYMNRESTSIQFIDSIENLLNYSSK